MAAPVAPWSMAAAALIPILPMLIEKLGDLLGGSSKHVDLTPMIAAHEASMAAAQEKFERSQDILRQQHEEAMQKWDDRSCEEAKRRQEDFNQRQEALAKAAAAEKAALQKNLAEMEKAMMDQQDEIQRLLEEIHKPAQRMAEKRAFINSLNMRIATSDKILAVGVKGSFKSTFYYLCGLSNVKPRRTGGDGTSSIIHLPDCIDSIGLNGWNQTDLLKLIVLLLYTGLPQDLILFCGDRTAQPVLQLGLLGIQGPLLVSMMNSFWTSVEPDDGAAPDFRLVPTQQGHRTVMRVEPENQMRRAYNLSKYKEIANNGHGRGITHHDNVTAIVAERKAAGTQPFQHLREVLGATFHVGEKSDPIVELLFRFVYIYEKKYKALADGQVKFMNAATLQMFDDA
jgi:hypothetical protein